jgi:exodeoxyribonuclease-3
MRIVTWNINSIKVRLERVLGFLEQHEPDALCLQELKVTDEVFPFEAIESAGYHAAVLGQKTYNGVALISREQPADVIRGMGPDDEDEQARLISGVVGGVRVFSAYMPNGQSVGSEKWGYKLAWMSRLRHWIDRTFDPDDPMALTGDFNVAPRLNDAQFPDRWAGSVLCAPASRGALSAIREFGFVDVFEKHHPEGHVYTWWDYQRLAFPKNDGLRIDHVYATSPLARHSTDTWVDRDARKKGPYESKPSDHAPVVADFDWPPQS